MMGRCFVEKLNYVPRTFASSSSLNVHPSLFFRSLIDFLLMSEKVLLVSVKHSDLKRCGDVYFVIFAHFLFNTSFVDYRLQSP